MEKLKVFGTVREKGKVSTTNRGLVCDEKIIENNKNIIKRKNRDRILCKTAKKKTVYIK